MESVSNPKRGCGHMKPGAVYLRADLSEFGTLPAFVTINPPIPYQEGSFRGIRYLNGLALDHVMGWSVISLDRDRAGAYWLDPPVASLELTKRLTKERFEARLAEVEEKVQGNGGSVDPLRYWDEDQKKMATGYSAVNLGAFAEAWTFDVLDWVGESFYPTPESFIEEARTLGMNRRLPKGIFPKISPGQTRVWFVHPKAITLPHEDGDEPTFAPGLIGYSYVTRTIYTAPEGQAVPESMKEKAGAGLVDIVELGPELEENGEEVIPPDLTDPIIVE